MNPRLPRLVLTLLLLCALPLSAQRPDHSALVQEKMAHITWIEGRWQGTATIRMGPETEVIEMVERAEMKVNNQVLTFEGVGSVEGEEVHRAFAVLSWAPDRQSYTMRSFTREGTQSDPEATLSDEGVLTWRIETPRGVMRYRIWQDELGRWMERGSFGSEEKGWHDFFEMILLRAD